MFSNNNIPSMNMIGPAQERNIALEQSYQELMGLKPKIGAGYRTVFSDIADELNDCTEAEKEFILQDEAYMKASINYQQQFNAFLIEVMGLQFINSKYGKSAEEMLVALKDARKRFVSISQTQAKDIAAKNALLEKQNEELQAELAKLLKEKEGVINEKRQRNTL